MKAWKTNQDERVELPPRRRLPTTKANNNTIIYFKLAEVLASSILPRLSSWKDETLIVTELVQRQTEDEVRHRTKESCYGAGGERMWCRRSGPPGTSLSGPVFILLQPLLSCAEGVELPPWTTTLLYPPPARRTPGRCCILASLLASQQTKNMTTSTTSSLDMLRSPMEVISMPIQHGCPSGDYVCMLIQRRYPKQGNPAMINNRLKISFFQFSLIRGLPIPRRSR